MAVALVNTGTEQTASSGTSFNYTGLNITAAISNSAAVFYALWFSATTISAPTATWNGVSAPLIGTLIGSSGFCYLGLFGLVNPASGAQTLALSWTTATTGMAVCGASFSGVNQTGGTTTFANPGNNSNFGSVTTLSRTQPTASGNMTLGGVALGQSATTTGISAPAGFTQIYVDRTALILAGTGQEGVFASTGASTVWTATQVSADFIALVTTDIVASGAAAVVEGGGQPGAIFRVNMAPGWRWRRPPGRKTFVCEKKLLKAA